MQISSLSKQLPFSHSGPIDNGGLRDAGLQRACYPDDERFRVDRVHRPDALGRRGQATHSHRSFSFAQKRWVERDVGFRAVRPTRVILATAHLDHDPANNRPRNLKSLCRWCHMLHDRPYHCAQRWLTYRLRWALGYLFTWPYPTSNRRNG